MDYKQLKTATQDLLCELRIDEVSLRLMAEGKSPDYPGVRTPADWENPHNKVQISQVTATKLINAGILTTHKV